MDVWVIVSNVDYPETRIGDDMVYLFRTKPTLSQHIDNIHRYKCFAKFASFCFLQLYKHRTASKQTTNRSQFANIIILRLLTIFVVVVVVVGGGGNTQSKLSTTSNKLVLLRLSVHLTKYA